ncbi:TPA: hypothetical protein HA238_05480, partial [Candidatus Micrarchaeota archaeon]|nr:hypothetical protein [Candidatus Micrarchaeota archaeon]
MKHTLAAGALLSSFIGIFSAYYLMEHQNTWRIAQLSIVNEADSSNDAGGARSISVSPRSSSKTNPWWLDTLESLFGEEEDEEKEKEKE